MRIAFIVDQPQRDLPGIILIATKLSCEGHICYLIPMNIQYGEVFSLMPDVLVVNYLRRANESKIQMYLEAGIQVAVLDTEGGILFDFDAYELGLAQDPKIRQGISCYFCWGPDLFEHAKQRNWFTSEQVFVSGTPRFDFYAEPWKDAEFWPIPTEFANNDPYVLINGTFTLANPRYQSCEKEIELLKRQGLSPEFIEYRLNHEKKALTGMVELTNKLATQFTNLTFVFRPHPFEESNTYQSLLVNKSNIKLVNDGDIRSWLKHARIVIQRGSTTAIEAVLSGIKVLEPAWIPSWTGNKTIEAVSISCPTIESIEPYLTRMDNPYFNSSSVFSDIIDREIYSWFYRIDGKSHERIANALVKTCSSSNLVSRSRCKEFLYGSKSTFTLCRLKIAAASRSVLNLPESWSFRRMKVIDDIEWDKSSKSFGVELVKSISDAIMSVKRSELSEPKPSKPLLVSRASGREDYMLPNLRGRSIVMRRTA